MQGSNKCINIFAEKLDNIQRNLFFFNHNIKASILWNENIA